MRKGILVATVAAFLTLPAYAADWRGPVDERGECYYDASSVEYGERGSVWFYCSRGSKVNTLLMQIQFACRDRMYHSLSSVNAAGDRTGPARSWTYIPPESVAETLAILVCRG